MLPSDLDRSVVMVDKFIPQVEALNHPATAAAMLHCGWGSVMEAVSAGVPVLAWPAFAD